MNMNDETRPSNTRNCCTSSGNEVRRQFADGSADSPHERLELDLGKQLPEGHLSTSVEVKKIKRRI
jgi:hypothetical protein